MSGKLKQPLLTLIIIGIRSLESPMGASLPASGYLLATLPPRSVSHPMFPHQFKTMCSSALCLIAAVKKYLKMEHAYENSAMLLKTLKKAVRIPARKPHPPSPQKPCLLLCRGGREAG